jgi:predicted dienelactone hydrolase
MRLFRLMFRLMMVAAVVAVFARAGVAQKSDGLYPVGMTTRAYVDGARRNWQNTGPRPLNTVVWYPAAKGVKTAPFAATAADAQFYGDAAMGKFFTPEDVAMGARLAGGKHPLILLSHGSTGIGLQFLWLAEYLAARGYIVAAVNHHGNTSAEGGLLTQGFATPWERAADVTAVLDDLLKDAEFGRAIDAKRIGAVGHSAGGATVIELAGGIFDEQALMDYCAASVSQGDATCEPRAIIAQSIAQMEELKKTDAVVQASVARSGAPHGDARIKGVFAMAPAIGPAFTAAGLSGVHVPVEIVVGDADVIAPPPSNAAHYAKLIPGAKLTVLPGVNHMTFGSECTALGVEKLDGCRDAASVDRVAVHHELDKQVLEFFEGVWTR